MLVERIAAASVAITLVAGALAAAVDITDDIRGTFQMGGLYPRQIRNLQAFTGALGGATASPITQSNDPKRPFQVGGDTFTDFISASNRACDNQKNVCAELSNNKTASFPVSDCDKQTDTCKEAAASATVTAFNALVSSNADFDFFCDI